MEKEPKKKEFDITPEDYLAAFSGASGLRVLTHLMVDFHFFEEADTAEEQVQRNMITRILRNMGAFQPKNFAYIARAFVNIAQANPLKIQKDED